MATFLILMAVFSFGEVLGKDLGTFGKTYDISEESLKDYLQKKISTTEEFHSALGHTKPVEGLQKATSYSVKSFDPTIQAKQDIRDIEGNLIVKKGEVFNPLDRVSFEKPLIFFDATDEKQLEWAKENESASKWILVKGKPLELEKSEGRPIYFDQGGVLSKHFVIKKVPTKISQEGRKLKVEEVPIKSNYKCYKGENT